MARLDPAVAAGRAAVRRLLSQLSDAVPSPPPVGTVLDGAGLAPLLLVACSGGTDSLALAAATAFEAPRRGWRAGAVIVDHGLLEDSAAVAARAAEQCRELGLDPVCVAAVRVERDSPAGIEAAARAARYGALEESARRHGAAVVLLAHTLDDQAETVLLALARGSGLTALSGMPARRDRFARPFLELTRRQTESIIRAQGLEAWHDPTNQPGGPYVSIRGQVRAELLPAARRILGEGFERALARTAARLAEDRDYLDAQVTALLARAASGRAGTASDNLDAASVIVNPAGGLATDQTETTVPVVLDIDRLAAAHPAIRRRALHRAALAAGARAGSLNAAQIEALDNLIGDWRGQGPVHLAGGILGRRKYGKLEFRKAPKET